MGNSADFNEKDTRSFISCKSYFFVYGNSSSAIPLNYTQKQTCRLLNFIQAGNMTSEDLQISSNSLHCIFTPEANLNPSMVHTAVLRPFVVGQ